MSFDLFGRRLGRTLLGLAAFVLAATTAHAALTISKGSTQNITCSKGVCSTTAIKAVLNVRDLQQRLAHADLRVASGSGAQDIVVKVSVGWTSVNRLTLDGYRSIVIDQPINVMGTGALTLITNDGGIFGDFSFAHQGRVKFWDMNSGLVINGNSYKLENSVAGLAADIEANPAGRYALADNYDAYADGTYGETAIRTPLTGFFEGLGNQITHLSTYGDNAGLFYAVFPGGTVRDLGVQADINSFYNEGILAALNKGEIRRCYTSGTVTGGGESGGLVGINFGGTISLSHSSAALSGATNAPVGGLVGSNDGGGTITESFATGTVTEYNGNLGGLVGYNTANISSSYATGAVSGASLWAGGGFVGYNDKGSRIASAYAAGTVTGGSGSSIGGFAGISQAKIDQAYSTGAVSTGDRGHLGGFIGADWKSGGITDAFWDLETSGVSDGSQGAGNIKNDAGLVGLTSQEFQSALPPGFDHKDWDEKPGVNGGFPYLKAVRPH